AMMQTSLLARSERVYGAHLARNGREPYSPPGGVTRQFELAAEEDYVIASTEDLTVRTDLGSTGSRSAVRNALAAHLAAHPEERGRWQVVPLHEIEAGS
ncbi:MAG: hypothetical protein ACREMQ_07320, partial [Longimicrobiales bacterium]